MKYAFAIFGATMGVYLANLYGVATDVGVSADSSATILVVGTSVGILAWAVDDARKAIVAAIWAAKDTKTTTGGTTAG